MQEATTAGTGDVQVDTRGLRCPLPVIRLAGAARSARPGTVLTVLSTDPAAEPDIAAWCRMRDAELLAQEWRTDRDGVFLRSTVRIHPELSSPEPSSPDPISAAE